MPQENQNTDIQSPMTYQISGPTLDWTNDADLFTRFTLWKQKCELILDCELENASDACKAKFMLQWSGDCGLETYNSWCIKDTTDDNLHEYWCHWQLIVNHMPMPNMHNLTCGITQHNKTNPLRTLCKYTKPKSKCISTGLASRHQEYSIMWCFCF